MTPLRAEPCFFGQQDRPLFGWVHPTPASSPLGLVICKAIGYEAVCSHRSVQTFASDAASNGIPALHFDYDGTGDSAGDDLDPRRLDGWLQSIRSAVQVLKQRSGVQQVCLLGIRMGATLAALVCAENPGILGLIAIAPVVDVRAYLRQLRALALAGTRTEPPAWAKMVPGLQEAAGFTLTSETRDALTPINLLKNVPASGTGLKDVLLIDRDDLPGNEAWADHLRNTGVRVEHRRLPGYTQMMLDSHEAVVPAQMVATATAWLKQRHASLSPAADASRSAAADSAATLSVQFSVTTRAAEARDIRETALFLDPGETIFGILAEPVTAAPEPATLVVMLNSGAVHHIGPNRLYVTLAREWAAAGIVVLRMDLAGLGDSRNHAGEPDNLVYTTKAVDDVTAAIAWIRARRRIGECHAIGLCSGAYHGFKAAAVGIPFDSVVAINPLTFSWRAGMSLAFPEYRIAADVMRYRKNAFQLASWSKLLKGHVDLWELAQVLVRRMVNVTANSARNVLRRLHIYLPGDLGTELWRISQQNTVLLFVFAEREPGLDLLRGGGGVVVERLRRRGHLHIQMIDGADHTFTPRWARERLIEVLDAHIRQRKNVPG